MSWSVHSKVAKANRPGEHISRKSLGNPFGKGSIFLAPTGVNQQDSTFEGMMDTSADSAQVFHKLADQYQEKYAALTLYDEFYGEFFKWLPAWRPRVLDAACGPGQVSKHLMSHFGNMELLGIDLAPRMVELARAAVPSARFLVHDCRDLAGLKGKFDGILFAFGLPYLTREDGAAVLQESANVLEAGGVLYVSTLLGNEADSGFQPCSTGDKVYIQYYSENELIHLLGKSGYAVRKKWRRASPDNAATSTWDLIVIAQKGNRIEL